MQRSEKAVANWADRAPVEEGWKRCLATVERALVERAMNLCGGNKSKAAELLGVHRRFLYEKLREFGMTPESE